MDIRGSQKDRNIGLAVYYEALINGRYHTEDWVDPDLDGERFEDGQLTIDKMRTFLEKKGWTEDELKANFIQQALMGIQEAERRIKQLEGLREEARLSLSRLPYTRALLQRDDMDKLIRYETSIERQFYRAINQLERLQRQRAGEAIPPPINIEVSQGG